MVREMKKRSIDRLSAGYSLIEMMVVVAIIGILMASSFTTFQETRYREEVNKPTKLLQKSIDTAKKLAREKRRVVSLCPSSNQATCNGVSWERGWIMFFDTNADGNLDNGEDLESVHTLERSIITISSSDSDNFITFDTRGDRHRNRAEDTTVLTVCHETSFARLARGVRINEAGGTYRLTDNDGDGVINNDANVDSGENLECN